MMLRNIIVPMAKLAAIGFVAQKALKLTQQRKSKGDVKPNIEREGPGQSRYLADGRDRVNVATEESFPASDPPSWSPMITG